LKRDEKEDAFFMDVKQHSKEAKKASSLKFHDILPKRTIPWASLGI